MTSFGYRSGTTWLHGLDVRVKFAVLILLGVAILKVGLLHLFGLIGLQIALLIYLGCSLKSIGTELRYLLVLLAIVFIVRVFSMPGDPIIRFGWLSASRQGLIAGALISARMLLVVLLGQILVITTRPAEIKAAVEWFLKPFPAVPRARIGTMLGLLLRLIPVLTAQVAETLAAQRARGVENRLNPVYRLTWLVLPFLRRSFASVDNLSMAMEARCYSDDRSGHRLSATWRDWMALAAGLTYAVFILIS